ncbi:hypothetical protein [Acetobacter syzygii]|uniref:hypothetical protein n=1 Tax=Acetobacter syzygii TaxID=146476 RepID=UPI001570E532|nr:hypothetical protein [Acetobacter syzygii]NSL93741.1 hypothetical protein [Acetobacter syzygii]
MTVTKGSQPQDPAPEPFDRNDPAALAEERKERKNQRKWLFLMGIVASVCYLVVLLVGLGWYFCSNAIPTLEVLGGWKALVASDAAFMLAAFIPMSIFWSLVKMASPHPIKGQEQKTDGEALANSIHDAATSIKDMISTFMTAVKK